MATLKPITPLRPLMQANVKPPSPLHPKNAPKTAFSHPQRRCRFHLRLALREQRRRRFHARDLRCRWAVAGPSHTSATRHHWCGGRRRDRTASGRATAHGRTKQPGPTSQAQRRPEHQRSRKQQAQSRIPAAAAVGGGRAWPGFKSMRRAAHQRLGAAGVEGAGGTGGPGCGGRGRWRGLAGLRDDAPSAARGADGSRAGRRPRAHTAARPTGQHVQRPEHQRSNSNTSGQANRPYSPPPPGSGRPV